MAKGRFKLPRGLRWRLPLTLAWMIFLGVMTYMNRLPVWVLIIYAIMSIAAIVAYGLDKRKASRGAWRIAENTLLAIDLLGGWPGGLTSQGLFHHKTKKRSYQLRYWLIVCAHFTLLAWWCFYR